MCVFPLVSFDFYARRMFLIGTDIFSVNDAVHYGATASCGLGHCDA